MFGKYSPTVMYSYNYDPDWWKRNLANKGDQFDKDGFNKFGFDESGEDREGNTIEQYNMMVRRSGEQGWIYIYPLYNEVYLRWNMILCSGKKKEIV